MALFEKKEKKQKEPEYLQSMINTKALNYRVYYMKPGEKLAYALISFIGGALVGYLFYGGLGRDADGNPTIITHVLNLIVMLVSGIFAVRLFIPLRIEQIKDKRFKTLKHQFRDMLDSISTSVGAGRNINRAFDAAYEDLKVQYEEGSYILNELEIINMGLRNNINIEDLLMDFGKRSGIDDIISFARVFDIGFRKGANLKDMIRNTHSILSDKMEITEEIETTISSSKLETYIMIVAPIFLVGIIKLMSPDMASNFSTPVGVVSTTIAVALFVGSYFISKKMMDIRL